MISTARGTWSGAGAAIASFGGIWLLREAGLPSRSVQQQKPGGFRGFVQTIFGKIFLIVLATVVVFATYVYVDTLLAIPAILLFGLAIPIWLGIKRPRFLAAMGLVIILAAAPLSTVVVTQDIRAPLAAADSMTGIPGTTGALMQNASVSPYTGTGATNFTWTVTINPAGIPKGNSSPLWLNLYVSTCPGATSTSAPSWCSAGYPFTLLNYTFPGNVTAPTTITFHYQIGSDGIWDWQMGIYTRNLTTHALFYQTLVGDPTYNGLEGPVVGDFLSTYGAVLPTIYFDDALFLGGPFFVILLIYLLFKNRERRKRESAQRAAGPVPPPGSPEAASALPPSVTKGQPPSASTTATTPERTCPNCNAVVYENETICWKCGASLGGTGGGPLPSSASQPKG
jgi:hypothetical protein